MPQRNVESHGGNMQFGTVTADVLNIAGGIANADLLDQDQTFTGVKHFSAAPVFDAGFTVSAGAVSFPANAVLDAAINSLSASKLTGSNTLPDGVLSTNVDLLNGIQSITAVKTFSAAPVFSAGFSSAAGQVGFFGTGDNLGGFATNVNARLVDVRAGTLATPEATITPLVKMSRISNLQGSQIAQGVGFDEGAVITASAYVASTSQVQATALYGLAVTQSSSSGLFGAGGQSLNADAQGVVGIGRSYGTRVGMGGYFEGQANAVGSLASGIQVKVDNFTGSDVSVNPTTGYSAVNGIWMAAGGNNKSGVALEFGNPFGQQFDVGIEFSSQVTSAKTGPTVTADIQTDSTATSSYVINGTHTFAIGVKNGAGALSMGHTNATDALNNTSALIELFSSVSLNPILALQGNGHVNITEKIGNSDGSSLLGVVGVAGNLLTGSIAGDMVWVLNTTGKSLLIGPAAAPVLKLTQAGTMGFFNTTPVGQQNAVGTATGFAAGTTAVTFHSDDTYTGNTGSTAYTINGIVHAMKVFGLLAA